MDTVLRAYPGYTVSSLLREDAHELMLLRELLDPDLGEGAMTNKVGIEVGAKDNASGPIDNIRDKFDKLQKQGAQGFGIGVAAGVTTFALNSIGSAADAAATAVVNFAVDSIQKAKEEEVGIGRLDAALKANIANWNGNRDAIEGVISSREKLAFSDGEQRDALAGLVTRTHDVNKALGLEREAMDLARLKGIDLATASQIIGKVYGGNTGILARYGIAVTKGASATEALAQIQKAAAGQAEAFANTSEGAAESLQIAIDDLQEDLGKHLLPLVASAAKLARDDLVPALEETMTGFDAVAKAVNDNQAVIAPFITTLELLTGTYGQLNMAGKANADGQDKANAIADAANKTIADRVALYQPYIDKLKKTTAATQDASGATTDWKGHLADLGSELSTSRDKTLDFKGAISKLIVEQGIASEDTGRLKRAFSEAKIQMQLDIDKLHELEAIKHPTKDQRLDILKTKDAIDDDKDAAREAATKLYDMGKITFPQLIARLRAIGVRIDNNTAAAREFNDALYASSVSSGQNNRNGRGGQKPKPTASGGFREQGDLILAGENGPELGIVGQNTTFFDAKKSAELMGGGGHTFNITMNGVGSDVSAGAAHAYALAVADTITATLRQQRARQA